MRTEWELKDPIRLIEDEPVEVLGSDGLGLAPYADIVARTALGTRGPFTVGVFADWGHGKSTVLKLARNMIRESEYKNVVTVWFNAWQYEQDEHPIVPLVASIVQQIEQHIEENKSFFEKTGKAVGKGYKEVVRSLRAIAYGFSAKAKVKVPGFAELEAGFVAKEMIDRDEALRSRDDPLLERSLYFNAFEALEQAVKGVIGDDRASYDPLTTPKIVVFIDDLDRCLPDQALKLLESIKLVLCQPGFVFALAVDRRVLEAYLVKRYKEDFGMGDSYDGAPQYLDKIIQLPLNLPVHTSRFDEYVESLKTRPELQDPVVQKTLLSLGASLSPGSGYNPRNLVRLLNNIVTDCHIWRSRLSDSLNGDQLEDEVALRLPICAVSRILSLHLDVGHQLQRRLAESQVTCAVIEKAPWKFGWPDRDKGVTGSAEADWVLLQEIKMLLEKKPFLTQVFEDDAGKRWLLNEQRRTEVEQFVVRVVDDNVSVTTRELEGEPPKEFDLDDYVRRELDIPPGTEISETDYESVKTLDLEFEHVTDEDLLTIEKLSGLTKLKLWDTLVTDDGLKSIEKLTGLTFLDLMGTQVTDEGLKSIEKLTGLTFLDLGRTQVTDEGLIRIEKLTGLTSLNVFKTQLTSAGLKSIANLTSLTWLNLSGTKVTDDGLKSIENLTELLNLHVNNTPVTDVGLKSVEKLTKLSVLRLSNTRVTDDGLKSIEKLTELSTLDLDDTQVTDEGLKSIEKLTELSTLDLDDTQVTDEGLKSIEKLTKLSVLRLRNTQVTDEGLKSIEKLTELSRLNLANTQVTDEGLKQLSRALPDCNVAH